MPTVRTRRKSLYGYPGTNIFEAPEPIIADRAPTTSDGAELGQLWIDTSANDFRVLCDNTSGTFTWTGTTGGATTLSSLTVNPGNLVVTAGDATVSAGTTTVQDLVVNAGATITGNVGITGNLSLTGDFDLSGPDAFSIVSTSNTDPAIYLHVNGGVAEVLRLRSSQGTSADSINLQSDAGGITLTSNLGTDSGINLNAVGGGVDIDGALQVNIASSEAAADAVSIRATDAAGGIVLDAGGIVSVAPDVASVASPTASSTQNFRVIRTIFTGFTTAAAASQDFTIVSSDILATSGILVQVTNFDGGNAAVMTMDGVTQSVGQIVVHTTNNGAGALDANVIVTVWVLS